MNDPRRDRRSRPRAELSSPCFLLLDGQPVGPFLVENLSAGGAMLTGGTSLPAGATVFLQLQLPGRRDPMSVAATVVRGPEATPRGASFAVEFRDLAPEDEDAIQSAVLEALEESRAHGGVGARKV